jgi:hypothetical protein
VIDQLAQRFAPKKPDPVEPAEAHLESIEPALPVVIESKAILTHCRPWCDHCGGWQAIETVWSDGTVAVACRTCRAVMPDRPTERKPKAKNDQQPQEVDK